MLRFPALFAAALGALVAASGPLGAENADGLIVKRSAYGVDETVDRLETALDEKGISIMARIDHASNAARAGETLPLTQLLLFGNPKLGTPLMQSARTAGIDLPMKALIYERDGAVFLAYNDPAHIAVRHGIEDRADVIDRMTRALDAITEQAVR